MSELHSLLPGELRGAVFIRVESSSRMEEGSLQGSVFEAALPFSWRDPKTGAPVADEPLASRSAQMISGWLRGFAKSGSRADASFSPSRDAISLSDVLRRELSDGIGLSKAPVYGEPGETVALGNIAKLWTGDGKERVTLGVCVRASEGSWRTLAPREALSPKQMEALERRIVRSYFEGARESLSKAGFELAQAPFMWTRRERAYGLPAVSGSALTSMMGGYGGSRGIEEFWSAIGALGEASRISEGLADAPGAGEPRLSAPKARL